MSPTPDIGMIQAAGKIFEIIEKCPAKGNCETVALFYGLQSWGE
ncbi:MAG: hypothetical protein ABR497_12240 [Kiritimatiellia bacterium]